MGENFFHDPEALSAAIDRLRGVSTDLSGAGTSLRGVLDEHHGCWGDDDIGKAFAQNFTEPLDNIKAGAENAPKGASDFSDEMASLREEFLAQDQNNANNVGNTDW